MSPGKPSEAQRKIGRKPRVLYTFTSVFPFDLFPDTIIIDEEKVTLIHRWFFLERHVVALYYDIIISVTLMTGILFAQLSFELTINTGKEEHVIHHLGKAHAEYARNLTIGMIHLHEKKEINFDEMTIDDIVHAAINDGAA